MTILYVETNLVMAIAKGQDREAARLLMAPPRGVRLVIPSVCFMEALSASATERKRIDRFLDDLSFQAREANRDGTSPHAALLYDDLRRAQLHQQKLSEDVDSRLSEALDALSLTAEMVALDAFIIEESLGAKLMGDPADNLILQCILRHARASPAGPKAFLSGNTRDFGRPDVRAALLGAGIDHYFAGAGAFLGWFGSQATP